jgi:branched-chain amino acid transport system substrate-binding protein
LKRSDELKGHGNDFETFYTCRSSRPADDRFRALAAETPGESSTEVKIGNTVPYSGPASAYSLVGKTDAAFFQWPNDQGGMAGRKINFTSLDDAHTPPRTVELTRRLVGDDQVAFVFNSLGTPTNPAVHRYLNQKSAATIYWHWRRQMG